ncbi:hypothetical protein L596_024513 [Steinernema carpocapsae]|uniref:Uncharacterized protein n=1 Tax=Steinernema carpocapsae TaxID=34508 RepID=A0A4U5MH01_STECR|nr:hypothetical protein L596_024513 [Steinernema carpocapsae]
MRPVLVAWVLLWLSALVFTSPSPQLVACGKADTKGTIAIAKWSNNSQSTPGFIPVRSYSKSTCTFDRVSQVCRVHFPGTSHAKALNETIVISASFQEFYDEDSTALGFLSYGPTFNFSNILLNQYECQSFHPCSLPPTGNSVWPDRLTVGSDKHSKCLSRQEWSNISLNECGSTPKELMFGGECGKETFVEVVYLCDQPRKVKPVKQVAPDYRNGYQTDQANLLEEFSVEVKLFWKTENQSYEQEVEAHRRLVMVYGKVEENGRYYHRETPFSLTTLEHNREKSRAYYSSEDVLSSLDYEISLAMYSRTDFLTKLASDLLWNETEPARTPSDYDIGGAAYHRLNLISASRPELAHLIQKMLKEQMKENTIGLESQELGFVGQKGAHDRIFKIYKRIFNPDLVFLHHVKQSAWSTALPWMWAAGCVVGAIFVGAFVAYRKFKITRTENFQLRYVRFTIDEEETVGVYM